MTGNEASSSFLDRRRREIMEDGETTVPLSFPELEREAKTALERAAFDFAATGAGLEATKRANRRGFAGWEIVPRVLRDVAERDLRTTLLGMELPAPLMIAPIGGQSVFDEEGELATASAAASLGLPMTLSTVASRSIEDVGERLGETPALLQLYWMQDRDVVASFIDRAERADYDAIVLTVDSQVPAWRVRNLANRYSSSQDARRANYLTDPVVERRLAEAEPGASAAGLPNVDKDPSLTWDDLASLREMTSLPILLKGVLHPEDAAMAVEHGLDGVVVSNHGARQIDGERGAVDALPGIAEAVPPTFPVLLDGGVRSGADVFKALALGADAVGVGRPYAYGLALAGERGVYEVLMNVLAELESVMGLSGFPTTASVGPSAVEPASNRAGTDGEPAHRG